MIFLPIESSKITVSGHRNNVLNRTLLDMTKIKTLGTFLELIQGVLTK